MNLNNEPSPLAESENQVAGLTDINALTGNSAYHAEQAVNEAAADDWTTIHNQQPWQSGFIGAVAEQPFDCWGCGAW